MSGNYTQKREIPIYFSLKNTNNKTQDDDLLTSSEEIKHTKVFCVCCGDYAPKDSDTCDKCLKELEKNYLRKKTKENICSICGQGLYIKADDRDYHLECRRKQNEQKNGVGYSSFTPDDTYTLNRRAMKCGISE